MNGADIFVQEYNIEAESTIQPILYSITKVFVNDSMSKRKKMLCEV